MQNVTSVIRKFMVGVSMAALSMAVLPVSVATAQVQAGQGAVAGTVTDATKAIVPGAHVVLSNPGIGYRKEVDTNAEGRYQFEALTVGDGYNLDVTAKGFASSKITNFPTSVGTIITQNVTLSVGAENTTIEVQGGTIEQVQTDTSAVSQVIDSTIFNESPLAVRDPNTFVGLVAGAAGSGGAGRGFAVNGARSGTGNFQLDGFDNNDQGLGGGAGPNAAGAVTSISPDAIQEYRVMTSVPNAEYGRAGGFATDTVLKSGTNTLHGSVFEYNRIQALAQNNFFSKRAGLRDHLVRNQFGGSIGGPIYKDKTFFFATVEFRRDRSGNPVQYTGITQDFYNFVKSGAFEKWTEGTAQQNTAFITDPNTGGKIDGQGFCPEYTGTTCPGEFADVATLGPVFTSLYARSPSSFPFGTRNFTNIPTDLFYGDTVYLPVNIYGDGDVIGTSTFNENRGSLKIDHKLTTRDQLAFTYAIELDNDLESAGQDFSVPGPPEDNYGGAHIFGARWSHTFTPNLLNDFRAGYLRHVRNFDAPGLFGVPATVAADSLSTGFGASAAIPQLFTENQFSYEDAVTYTRGRHTPKAGFRFSRTRNGSSFYNDVNGSIYTWGAPGLLTDGFNEVDAERILDGGTTGAYHSAYGTLYYASASQDPTTQSAPDPYRGYRANEFAAYVQDDWKATARLVVNYGLRWDYFGPPHNFRAGIDSNVYFGSDTAVKTTNPFAPNVPLYLAEQGAVFKCVGVGTPCGTFAPASGTDTIWDRDLNNFGPRLGFSYDTFGNGKMVLRGGFGVGFDRLYNNVYENIRFNGPHFVDNTTGYGAGAGGISEALRAGLYKVPFSGNNLLSGANPVPRHVNQHLKTAYYEQIHFGMQTNVLKGYVIETNYIGTLGRQLVGIENVNTFEGRVACSTAAQKTACTAAGIAAANQSTARPDPAFGNDNFRTNGFSSNYNAGQISVRKGFSHGFQLLGNYTYSKALDQISDVFTIKSGGTGIPTPYNPSHNYGPADFDTRHLASFIANYRSHSEAHKFLLDGWGVSPILQMQSGTPIYIKNGSSTYDPNKDGTTGVERAVYAGTGSQRSAINHAVSPAGNGSAGTGFIKSGTFKSYVCPANVNAGLWCDVPGDRNTFTGLRQYNLDMQVSKHFKLYERYSLTLQAAFFDVDGHTEFGNPSGDINSTSFGESTGAGNREGQLSARFEF
ncbi:MAG TPA: TonB-dependent receptor [Acidobacteriaceae bacterium]